MVSKLLILVTIFYFSYGAREHVLLIFDGLIVTKFGQLFVSGKLSFSPTFKFV